MSAAAIASATATAATTTTTTTDTADQSSGYALRHFFMPPFLSFDEKAAQEGRPSSEERHKGVIIASPNRVCNTFAKIPNNDGIDALVQGGGLDDNPVKWVDLEGARAFYSSTLALYPQYTPELSSSTLEVFATRMHHMNKTTRTILNFPSLKVLVLQRSAYDHYTNRFEAEDSTKALLPIMQSLPREGAASHPLRFICVEGSITESFAKTLMGYMHEEGSAYKNLDYVLTDSHILTRDPLPEGFPEQEEDEGIVDYAVRLLTRGGPLSHIVPHNLYLHDVDPAGMYTHLTRFENCV